MKTKITIFVCCICLSNTLLSQSYTFRNYGVAEGLPSSEVYDVIQDSKGFIWFATDNGVVRFDGLEMLTFGVQNGLHDPVVFEIIEDHRKRIWFRTFSSQLFYYENGIIVPYQYNHLTVNASARTRMNAMHIDAEDRLWFTNLWGVMTKIDHQGKLMQDSVPAKQIIYDDQDTIHTIGWKVHKNSNKAWAYEVNFDGNPFHLDSDLGATNSLCPIIRWRGSIYVAFGHTIYKYDGTSLEKVLTCQAQILSLTVDQIDNLWVGYHNGGGAERYDTPDFKSSVRPDFAKHRSVSKIYLDNDSGLWMTTLDRGVFYIPNLDVEFRGFPAKVNSVFSSGQNVIVATDDGKATLIQKTGVKKSVQVSGVRHSPMFRDKAGNFWVPGAALNVFDKNLSRIRTFDKLFVGTPASFTEDDYGNVLGIAYGGYGLRKFDRSLKMRSFVENNSRKIVRAVLSRGSELLIAGPLGLGVYDTSTLELLYAPASLSKFKISKMLCWKDTTLLLATIGNGLLVVNMNSWLYEQYSKEKRLMASNIYAASIDSTMLWLGTEEGILATDVNSLVKNKPKFYQFSQDQGLTENKISFLTVADKAIWAFSDKGISIIPTASTSSNIRSPEFYIKRIFVNKRRMETVDNISMPFGNTDLEVVFGFLSLKNQNILCRYKLNNENSWTYLNERRLYFSSLAPDKYVLSIEYSTDNLTWTKVNFDFAFEVTPPWWETWQVRLLTVIFLMSIIYLYLHNRYRSLHLHRLKVLQTEFETLNRERKRIAKELHDGVATNLSAIKLTVGHLLKEHPLAADVNDQFHSTLKEIKNLIYEMTPAELEKDTLNQSLRNYIDKLNKTLPIKIDLQMTGCEVCDPHIGLILFRIMQELLANAIKHSAAKNISIQLSSTATTLTCVFLDDGVGFAFDTSKGMGLANIQSRIKSIRGALIFNSVPNLTSYTIQLPLSL